MIFFITLAFTHGNKIPIVNIPSEGPLSIALMVIESWRTCVPVLSTTKTKPTHITPKITTVSFINISAHLVVNGVLRNGFIKSSNTTAAKELSPVDNELNKLYKKKIKIKNYLFIYDIIYINFTWVQR